MDDTCGSIIDDLRRRIHHLEENRRFFQNALEMVLSLGDFGKTRNDGHDDSDEEKPYFKEAAERIEKVKEMLKI